MNLRVSRASEENRESQRKGRKERKDENETEQAWALRVPRSERARFFAAYDALRVEGPLDARGERLRELAALPLTSHDLVEARDTCLRAHSYLLDLESAHELSATMLDEGLVSDSALLAWSEHGLPRVEPMFRDCAELVGRLR